MTIEILVNLLIEVKDIAQSLSRIAESLEQLEARKSLLDRPLTRGDADEVI